MGFIGSFIFGFTLPLRAIKLILSNRKVFLWALVPLTLSIIVYVILWGAVLAPARDWISLQFQNWLTGMFSSGEYSQLRNAAQWVVRMAVQALFFVTMLFSFAWVANFAALPVNDFLAQSVEQALIPPLERPASRGWTHDLRLIWIDFKKSLLSLLGLLLCLSVSWVPIMNLIALVIAWLLLTFQYVSFPQTRREIGARQAVIEILKNFGSSVGFGLVVSLCLTIPVLAIIVPTIAVVSGTMLFARMQRG